VYLGSTERAEGVEESKTLFAFQRARSYQVNGDWSELLDRRREELAVEARVICYGRDSVGTIADIDRLLVLLGRLLL